MKPELKNKRCTVCDRKHKEIPQNARPWIDDEMKLAGKPHLIGWFWECKCGSTMFKKIQEKIQEVA